MPLYRLFSVFVICCALTIAGCSKSSTEAGLEKEDLDGDGIGNIYDPDIDGDGIPNGQDPDIDGDGIPNDQDPDMDGDGKPNGKDPDPENNDPNYCDQIQVLGLNDEQTTGSEIVLTWYLQSSKTNDENCVLKEGVGAALVMEHASAVGATTTDSEPTNPLLNSRAKITIPHTCVQGETVKVTYDFTEIATLIKADPKAAGWTVTETHRADPERCDFDGDGLADFGPAACPATATGTYPNCSCPAGEGYDVSSNACLDTSEGIGSGPIQLCPAEATGTHPSCSCPTGSKYDAETNSCSCDKPQADLIQRDGELYWAVRTYRNGYHCEYSDDQLDAQIVEWSWHLEGNTEKKGSLETPIRFGDLGPDTASIYEQYCLLEPTSIGSKSQQVVSTAKLEDGTFMLGDSKFGAYSSISFSKLQCPADADPLSSNDSDGDGIPNGSDPDVDGDGTPNTSDKDIDGDGIENKNDPDIDGDGISNGIDPDADGDGIPDAEDDTPGGPS